MVWAIPWGRLMEAPSPPYTPHRIAKGAEHGAIFIEPYSPPLDGTHVGSSVYEVSANTGRQVWPPSPLR